MKDNETPNITQVTTVGGLVFFVFVFCVVRVDLRHLYRINLFPQKHLH